MGFFPATFPRAKISLMIVSAYFSYACAGLNFLKDATADSLMSLFLMTTFLRIQFLALFRINRSGVYLGLVKVAKDLTK